MQLLEIIESFSEIQQRLTDALPPILRPFIRETSLFKKRGAMVIGPRGVGKTTLLLHTARDAKILYVAVDNPIAAQVSLSEFARQVFAEGYNGIIFDEVHYAKDWSLHVKAIYDSYPKHKIWISDSSSLLLRKGVADLSRRFPKTHVPFLSFREYLSLKYNIELDPFDPFTAPSASFNKVINACDIKTAFKFYKKEGFRPIFLEGDYQQKILGIIEKSIFNDVPFFVPRLQENHLRLMNAVIGYLASVSIPTVNVEALSTEWALGKEKLYQLLNVMEHVGLINIIRYPADNRALGKGAKMFLADPSMYSVLSDKIENVREALVATLFRQMGESIYACKDERKGDFQVRKMRLEVGGRDKDLKHADFVLRDDLEYPGNRALPLWSLGMMY